MKNHVLSVGSEFPAFEKKAVVSIEKGKEFGTVSDKDYKSKNPIRYKFYRSPVALSQDC